MTIESAVSGSEKGNAGEDGFATAFEAALGKVDLSGAEFAPKDDDPPEQNTEKPVDETETDEPAVSTKPTDKPLAKADKAPVTTEQPAAATQAPAHWDSAKREAFAALPPQAQKIVTDLTKGFEADYTRKSTELADDRRFASSVRSLINDDHRSQMRRAGLTDEQGIAHLVKLNDLYTRDPVGYVRMVVERTGLDPRQIFNLTGDAPQAQGQQPAPNGADPYSQLYGIIQHLSQEVDGFKRERHQTTERTVNQVIERFAKETDDTGNPVHPHFDRVQAKMAELLYTPSYTAIEDYGQRLKAAYDAAVYLDPDIRPQIVDAEVQRRMKEAREKEDVAKARKAKAPVNAPAATTGKVKTGSLESAIRQSMGDLGVS